MSSSLSVDKELLADQVIYKLAGQIDEDADLSVITADGKEKIVFDLGSITMINSCGIRDWVEFQSELDDNLKIVYRNCPQVIVEQLNIIKGFIRDGGVVESFYAPYYNEVMDHEVKILLKPEEVIDCKAPSRRDEDGNELEFDDIELQYFNFLKR